MNEAVQIVKSLSDVQAISLIKELYRKVFKGVTYTEIAGHLPVDEASIQVLKNSDTLAKKNKLSSQESVRVSRQMLLSFAHDEQLAPLLIDAWNEIKDDDDLLVETILALGLVVNLTLFMASSNIKYKDGKFSFHKEKTSPESLKPILEPVTEMVKRIPKVS